MSLSVNFSRREFVRTLGGLVLTPLPRLLPVSESRQKPNVQYVAIKTLEGKEELSRDLWYLTSNYPIPENCPMSEWQNHPPHWQGGGMNTYELFAEGIIKRELIARSMDIFSSELQTDIALYGEDCVKSTVHYALDRHIGKLMMQTKGVPYPGIFLSGISGEPFAKQLHPNIEYVNGNLGIYTKFTEADAEEVLQGISQLPFQKIYQPARKFVVESYGHLLPHS
ncbi:MAG: hypothetical protein HYZ79_09555 [Candidatus Melainabacteria bacterium]|nr:hypothetical protein [Candidatus Melainabacteria bacterium]